MRRLWLLFAQTVTVGLALWFIVATLKPDWIAGAFNSRARPAQSTVPMQEAAPNAPALDSYRHAAHQAMPSVVNIFTTTEARPQKSPFQNDPFFRKFFGDQFDEQQQDDKQSSLGSGVIVSPQGYILTNNHVVEAADKIEVALADGRKASAKVVGIDPETDLAVIKIDLPNLPAITLGHPESSSVGDVVLINPGNSGGALVDTNGNLLGINTAIYSRTGGNLGIGFAIPMSTAKTVMEAIISHGQVVRGWIGVEPQDITPELAESFGLGKKTGAIIAGVLKGGPADRAGMRPGDILVSIDGKPVADTTEMLNVIAQLTPGQEIAMTVLRKSQETRLNITVGKRPPPPKSDDSDEE